MGRGVTEEARYGPCASCGEPTYGLRHARCEAELLASLELTVTDPEASEAEQVEAHVEREALRLAREAEEANECPEGCGRPAHPQGGPCTPCYRRGEVNL